MSHSARDREAGSTAPMDPDGFVGVAAALCALVLAVLLIMEA